MKRSIVDYLAENARQSPDRVLVRFRDSEITFKQIEEKSARCRGALAALGIKPATGRAGDERLPGDDDRHARRDGHGRDRRAVQHDAEAAELEYMLKDSGAKLVIVTPEHLENAKAASAPRSSMT
jgi:non-ribosomal peptide synthetase component F